jgi:hypothetical protein
MVNDWNEEQETPIQERQSLLESLNKETTSCLIPSYMHVTTYSTSKRSQHSYLCPAIPFRPCPFTELVSFCHTRLKEPAYDNIPKRHWLAVVLFPNGTTFSLTMTARSRCLACIITSLTLQYCYHTCVCTVHTAQTLLRSSKVINSFL